MFAHLANSAKTWLYGQKHECTCSGLDEESNTPLHRAILEKDQADILEALKNPKYLEHQNQQGMTPLVLAAHHKKWPIVHSILLETIHQQDKSSLSSVFHLSVADNQLEIVKWLLDVKKVDINHRDLNDQKSALHIAIENNLSGMLSLLLKKEADVLIFNKARQSSIIYAVILDQWELVEIIATLRPIDSDYRGINRPAYIDCMMSEYGFALLYAVSVGRGDIVKILRKAGAKFERSIYGKDAVIIAIEKNHPDILQYLIESGIELLPSLSYEYIEEKKNPVYLTMNHLEYAAYLERWPHVELIAKAKSAGLLLKPMYGKVLLKAVSAKALDAVIALSEAGASLTMKATDGSTCLHLAINNDDEAMLRYLVKNGANLFAEYSLGLNPLRYAIDQGKWSFVQLIAQLKSGDKQYRALFGSALLEAARKDHFPTVKALYRAGASLTEKSVQCESSVSVLLSQNQTIPVLSSLFSPIASGWDMSSSAIREAKDKLSPLSKETDSVLPHIAVYNNNAAMLKFFLRTNVNLTTEDHKGETVIQKAVNEKKWPLVELIAEARFTDENDAARYGYALFHASFEGEEKCVKKLLKGNTPLTYQHDQSSIAQAAIFGGSARILKRIIQRNPEFCENGKGLMLMKLAANSCHWEQVIFLAAHIKKSIKIEKEAELAFQTVLMQALDQKQYDTVYHLVHVVGISLNFYDQRGDTLLHRVIALHDEKNDHLKSIIFLLTQGLELQQKNKAGKTSFEYAEDLDKKSQAIEETQNLDDEFQAVEKIYLNKVQIVNKASFEKALPYLINMRYLSNENIIHDLPIEILEIIFRFASGNAHLRLDKVEPKVKTQLAAISTNCFLKECAKFSLFPPVAENLKGILEKNAADPQLFEAIKTLHEASKDEETNAAFEKYQLQRYL